MIEIVVPALVVSGFAAWTIRALRERPSAATVRSWLDASEANATTHLENQRKYTESMVGYYKACDACGQVYKKRAMQEVQHWIEDPGQISDGVLKYRTPPSRHLEGHRTEWFCTKHKLPYTIVLRTMGYTYRFNKDGSMDTGPKPRYFNRVPVRSNPEWEEYTPPQKTEEQYV